MRTKIGISNFINFTVFLKELSSNNFLKTKKKPEKDFKSKKILLKGTFSKKNSIKGLSANKLHKRDMAAYNLHKGTVNLKKYYLKGLSDKNS